jgi:hypothetical protein
MKTFARIITTFLMMISVNKTYSQASEEEISKEFYRADGNLNLVLNNLPKGWVFKEDKGFFKIFRKDSVLMLAENRINAPVEKSEDRIKRIKEYGVKTLCEIVIRYENKWDFLKVQEAQIKNASTMDEINKLADKLKISSLLDPQLSRKNQAVYTPKNNKDKLNIANYYKEKERLEKTLIKTPDYTSQFYSLFNVSSNGMEDNMHIVYPSEASVELYTILSLFREVCGK